MLSHKEILERYESAETADRDQAELAVKDMLFVEEEGGHYTEEARRARKKRPMFQIDLVSPGIDQAIGDQRQTETNITVFPQKDGTKDVAKIFTGLIRSIDRDSKSQNIYDCVYDEVLKGGIGGWRILTEFHPDNPFIMRIYKKWIPSAASSLKFDPSAELLTKEDGEYAFIDSSMLSAAFKKEYPESAPSGFFKNLFTPSMWFQQDRVQVSEFFYKDPYTKKVGLLSDGRVIDLEEEEKVLDELRDKEITVIEEKEVDSYKVKTVKMNGNDFLEEWQDWDGKYIPIIPVYGRTATIQGKKYYRGMVRKSKDPSRILDYSISTTVEVTALSPKDPIWYTPAMKDGHQDKWKTYPVDNHHFMPFNADPAFPGQTPQRGGAPTVQDALILQISQAERNIQSTMGLEGPSMGQQIDPQSGLAISRLQQTGDRGLFIFPDNLEKAKQYDAIQLIDLMQRTYDTERVEKVLNEDGTDEDVKINERVYELNDPITDEETGEQVIVNDTSKGTYGVVVKTGPASMTKRKETVDQIMELITTPGMGETLGPLVLDLIIDSMDLNKGEELKSRIRKFQIEQGLVKPTDEEKEELGISDEPPPPDPMQQGLVENINAQTDETAMKTEKLMAEIRKVDSEAQENIMTAYQKAVDSMNSNIETLIKQAQAGIPVTPEQLQVVEGSVALVDEATVDVLENQEVADSLPLNAKDQAFQEQQRKQNEQVQAQQDQLILQGQPTGPEGVNPGAQVPDNSGFIEE
jgi:hypothetical protein